MEILLRIAQEFLIQKKFMRNKFKQFSSNMFKRDFYLEFLKFYIFFKINYIGFHKYFQFMQWMIFYEKRESPR